MHLAAEHFTAYTPLGTDCSGAYLGGTCTSPLGDEKGVLIFNVKNMVKCEQF